MTLDRRDFGLAALALLAGAAPLQAQQPPDAPPRRSGRPGRPPMGGRDGAANFFASKLQGKDPEEQRILAVLQEMAPQQRRMMSVPMDDGRFLRLLAEFSGAKNVVEIGTSQGMSALFFCLALRKTGGHLTTHEIDEGRAGIAKENFKKAGVEPLVTLVLGDAHEEVNKIGQPIDILFQDADKEGYLDYLDKLLPKLRPGGLIVSHNINPRQADPKYIKRITEDPALESLLVTLQEGGISLTLKKR